MKQNHGPVRPGAPTVQHQKTLDIKIRVARISLLSFAPSLALSLAGRESGGMSEVVRAVSPHVRRPLQAACYTGRKLSPPGMSFRSVCVSCRASRCYHFLRYHFLRYKKQVGTQSAQFLIFASNLILNFRYPW